MTRLLTVGIVAFALAMGAALGADINLPTSIQLELRLAREAANTTAWDRHAAWILTGRQTSRGLDGAWRMIVESNTGRTHETADFGLFKTETVWDGRRFWRKGRSGGVHAIGSAFAQRTNLTNAWLARRGYLSPDGVDAVWEDLGAKEADGRSHLRFMVTPSGGEPVELWFDRGTHLLARSIQRLSTTTKTVRYLDYRRERGAVFAFTTVIEEGTNTDTVHVARVDAASTIADGEFARPSPPRDFTIDGGRITVPMEFDGFVVVQAMLNGQGPFAFILDTGGRAILTAEAAKQLALPLAGGARAGGAGEGSIAARFTKVDRIDIGGLHLRDFSFGVLPLQYDTVERGARPAFAGIMGVELFERLAMTLDYRNQKLTLEPLATFRYSGRGTFLPISFTDDMPLVAGEIDGIAGDIALDTGSPEPLVIQGFWAGRHGLGERLKRGFPLIASGPVGGRISLWASRADLKLGGTMLPRVVSYYAEDQAGAFSSRSEAGLAGNDVFAHFTVAFDYLREGVWLEPTPGFIAKPFDRAGLVVGKPRRESFKVESVIADTPAANAGIQAGDEITAVDGRPASEMSGWDFGRAARRPPGTKMTLDVLSHGAAQKVTFVLRELLP